MKYILVLCVLLGACRHSIPVKISKVKDSVWHRFDYSEHKYYDTVDGKSVLYDTEGPSSIDSSTWTITRIEVDTDGSKIYYYQREFYFEWCITPADTMRTSECDQINHIVYEYMFSARLFPWCNDKNIKPDTLSGKCKNLRDTIRLSTFEHFGSKQIWKESVKKKQLKWPKQLRDSIWDIEKGVDTLWGTLYIDVAGGTISAKGFVRSYTPMECHMAIYSPHDQEIIDTIENRDTFTGLMGVMVKGIQYGWLTYKPNTVTN